MSDKHFAELVKHLKQHGGFVRWHVIVSWYNKHYITVDETSAHRYTRIIMQLLVRYADSNGLMTMTQLVDQLSPNFSAFNQRFTDLGEEYNSVLEYKILAEVCGKLILTQWTSIPYHEGVL